MRKVLAIVVLCGFCSLAAMAAESDYPKGEFFGGYQYSHLEGGVNANGFDFALNGNFNNYFGVTADLGSSFTTQNGVSLHNYTYTFGPQLSLRANKAYTPFVHVLIGGDHASASFAGVSATGNGFAMLGGGGVDINFSRNMAFRGGADWLWMHNNGVSSSKNVRMLTGIVFRY
ncbi:MAG: outer membrane beta-barrel protein [Terriglobales bacterium]